MDAFGQTEIVSSVTLNESGLVPGDSLGVGNGAGSPASIGAAERALLSSPGMRPLLHSRAQPARAP